MTKALQLGELRNFAYIRDLMNLCEIEIGTRYPSSVSRCSFAFFPFHLKDAILFYGNDNTKKKEIMNQYATQRCEDAHSHWLNVSTLAH